MPSRILTGCVAAILTSAVAVSVVPAAAAPVTTYKNCTALNKAYPHGVGKKGAKDKVTGSTKPVTNYAVNTKVYNQNTKSDRDHDGIACEKR